MLFSLSCIEAFCCTSVIISGNVRADGRPVMLKHRDTGELNNCIKWFQGEKYSFIGLMNSSATGGEVWSGTNSAGFCIMNTATYDLKDDDVPAGMMDREGEVMFEALGRCASLADFEKYLSEREKPWGIEANFGIIDALGEAAYYEVNNHSWKRYDVADQEGGWMVVTNFTRSGRAEDRKGVDRFEKAESIMEGMDVSTVSHKEIFNMISRSGKPIVRDITSASIVFEGVAPGEDPLRTVMWTICGCPTTCVYVPLMVREKDHVPSYLKNDSEKSKICSYSLVIKGICGFENGCASECRKVEEYVDSSFSPGMSGWRYDLLLKRIFRKYSRMCRSKWPDAGYKNC